MRLSAELLEESLLQDLYDAGWDGPGEYPGQSLRQFQMCSLAKSIVKKFHNDESGGPRDDSALALFLECNKRCSDFVTVSPRRLDEELIINETKVIIDKFFNPQCFVEKGSSAHNREPFLLNLSDIASHFGLGNGSNIGAPNTDMYSKYVLSNMAHTNDALPTLFRHAISVDQRWTYVEAYRSAILGYEKVSGSRLSFAPKTGTISRTIATEPILNMFFQKGIGGVLEKRIKEVFSIDLSDQPDRNARLARCGSVTGRYGTIDLSSASDSISLSLVRFLLPNEPMSWLMRCRSPTTVLPDGREVELHMISSMGNGFTFPLQTMIFASLVTAAYRVYDIPIVRNGKTTDGNFAVFGDDIIVDARVYDPVVRCLEVLGFSVNRDKSFNTGLFRESCGHDYFYGHNVRGVYVKRLLNDGDCYSAINRLLRWSAKSGIFLHRAITYLRRGCRFIGVPFREGDDSGIKIPLSLLRTVRRNSNGAVRYLALVAVPATVRIPSVDLDSELTLRDKDRLRKQLRNFVYVPDGLLMCLVAGYLRGGFLGQRSQTRRTVLRRRLSPGWDPIDADLGGIRGSASRWKAMAELSLVS